MRCVSEPALTLPDAPLSENLTTHSHSELFDFFARLSWDIFSPLYHEHFILKGEQSAQMTDPSGPPAGGSTVLAAVHQCPSSDLPSDGQVLIVDENASIFQSGRMKYDLQEEGLLNTSPL